MSILEPKGIGTEMYELQQMLSDFRVGVRPVTSPAGVAGLARMETFHRWELKELTFSCSHGHGEQEMISFRSGTDTGGVLCDYLLLACRCSKIEYL